MRLYDRLCEKVLNEQLPKNTWKDVSPQEYGDDLIDIVQNAYKNTPQGSFVNTQLDLTKSDWHAVDVDIYPDVDATIFYREARANEPWRGHKIQGIGHDGSRRAIDAVLQRLEQLLARKGWWVEASDAMEHVLYKRGVAYIGDQQTAERVFPGSGLTMTGDRGKYQRNAGGSQVQETIFGHPII